MRKLVILQFITLDGVIQAPGNPYEDTTSGFQFSGWVAPYFDDFLAGVLDKQTNHPFDLLLGRKTYEIFAAHWPYQSAEDPMASTYNQAKKYVVSRTLHDLSWDHSHLLEGDVATAVKALKQETGPEIQVYGSGNLTQTLLKHDLVDELWLKIFPLTFGTGKKLFAEGTIPAAFKLEESSSSPKGVIVASFKRAGAVRTGTFETQQPSTAELARRKKWEAEEV